MAHDTNRDLSTAHAIAEAVRDAGGRTFFVGGCVRDGAMGIAIKDIDIEVHGVTPAALEAILDTIGERTVMGASFGVYGLKHTDLDIAMPRCESAIGRGHKDFAVSVDPFLGTRKAAMRRDFTVNAMMQDVLTGEIVDHFGGLDDIRRGVLRHVNDATFPEDPLRVLRGAQFAARFGFTVAPETLRIMSGMDLSTLARERVTGEAEKALMRSDKPSIFFGVLREVGQLDIWFPELKALIGVMQEPRFHPEGDVWNHTMQVLDRAAELREKAAHPLYFMLSALMHDYGKPACTQVIDGRIRAFGHETAGVGIAECALARLTGEVDALHYVKNMVLMHMRPNALFTMNPAGKKVMAMLDASVCPEDLLLLSEADSRGRGGDFPNEYDACRAWLRENLEAYRELMAKPQVRGADLIAAGLKPGPVVGEALAYAHKLHLAGADRDSALKQALGYARGLLK